MPYQISKGVYKGHPIIRIVNDRGLPLSFGLSKGRAILDNIKFIKDWVEANEKLNIPKEIEKMEMEMARLKSRLE